MHADKAIFKMKAGETYFRTPVDVPRWTSMMEADQHFVLLGSCFAQNIGEKFREYGLNALVNPLGVTYNPESIAIQVRQSLAGQLPADHLPLFRSAEGWRCWWASSVIQGDDRETCRASAQRGFSMLRDALQKSDFLFVTLGTNVCYRLIQNNMTVANCHKMPDRYFQETRLDVQASAQILAGMMELLGSECPQLKVVFTVSPYRYKKYGFHGSQLSKAVLLLAVEQVVEAFPERASYFPAYEIVLDELRDYRFYADDMIHPSALAVDYIWQRLAQNCMSPVMQQRLKDYEPIRRAAKHITANS